jgi:hypothetical protein
MGVEVEKTGTRPDNSETLPQMSILPSVFSWQISFDCSGFLDSRPPEPNLATAPEASSTIKTATHGFSIVTAADGKRAVQFIKTLDDGTKVTYQICEGARGTPYGQLAQYGKEKLKGATLKTHSEFQEMVDELFKAVEGQMVADGELQTEDEALKLAFQIVGEGVRTEYRWLFVKFLTEDKDGGRAVFGRRVSVDGRDWHADGGRLYCAFFGVSSPESEKLDS